MNIHDGRSPGNPLMLAVVGAAGLTMLAIADPATNPLFPPCVWHAATGWLCPGCGSARAIHALLHGDVGVALRTNPLAVAAMPLGAADLLQRVRGDHGLMTYGVRPVYLRALAIGVALFGILRNVAL